MTNGAGDAPGDDEIHLRLREPLDVLGAIPYLVGYHPRESVVVIGLRQRLLYVTARADLPAAADGVEATAAGMQGMLDTTGVDGAIVVGYGPADRVEPLLPVLFAAFDRMEVDVLEALRADGGRYWSYVCPDPLCCRPEGMPYDPRDSRAAAEATVAGLTAMPDREAYERQVEAVSGPARLEMAAATARNHDRLHQVIGTASDQRTVATRLIREGAAAIRRGLQVQRQGGRLDDDAVAWLSLLVCWAQVRDVAWDRIGETSASLLLSRGLWLDVMRRADGGLIAAPGSLFALAAWRRGELVLARLALGRVLELEPDYPMAMFMDSAIERGLPPSILLEWRRMTTPSTRDDARGQRLTRSRGRRPRRRSSSGRAGSRPA